MEVINRPPMPAPINPPVEPVNPILAGLKDRQIHYEIKKRRWQRWVFYVIISVMFIAMIAYIVKVYNDNLKLVENVLAAKQNLQTATDSLTESEKKLLDIQKQIEELKKASADNQAALDQKTADLQQATQDQTDLINKYNNFKVKLGSADANIYSFLVNTGVGVSLNDLIKIPVAEYNFGGEDSDGDGLSNMIEVALGTDPNKKDTDGDGFEDKAEVIGGFNPVGSGKSPISPAFIEMNKGVILIQVDQNKEAWYVSLKDGQRYFLGRPAEVLEEIERL